MGYYELWYLSLSNRPPWSQIILIVRWWSYIPGQRLRVPYAPYIWYLVYTHPHPFQYTISVPHSDSHLCSSAPASNFTSVSLSASLTPSQSILP